MQEKLPDIRGDVKEIGWGNQIRSYVMQPYTMVKDHRTGEESGNVNAVLDGNIDNFISAYLKYLQLGEKTPESVSGRLSERVRVISDPGALLFRHLISRKRAGLLRRGCFKPRKLIYVLQFRGSTRVRTEATSICAGWLARVERREGKILILFFFEKTVAHIPESIC